MEVKPTRPLRIWIIPIIAGTMFFLPWFLPDWIRGWQPPVIIPVVMWITCYLLLIVQILLEYSCWDLRRRWSRVWAYSLTLVANSITVMFLILEVRDSGWKAPGISQLLPFPLWRQVILVALLSPCYVWVLVAVLCMFGRHADRVEGRFVPLVFAAIGSLQLFVLAASE